MLQTIRDHAQGVLAWIIVGFISVPFALWGINQYASPSRKEVIAEVSGAELLAQDFQWEVRRRQQQLRALAQRNIDLSFMETQIKQSTLNDMIEEAVLTQTAIDQGFRIGDTLLAQYIHNSQEFKEAGVFSQSRYEFILKNQGFTPISFERKQRQAMLVDQVNSGIMRSAFLTDYEQQQRLRLEQQQRYLSYLVIPLEHFTDSRVISEADVEAYYNTHQADYMTLEKVSVEYVELVQDALAEMQTVTEETLTQLYEERLASFTTPAQWHARHILLNIDDTAPPEQIQTTEQKAQEILARIRGGESFEAVAQEISEDTESAKKGGDLGWFGPGDMVKPFEDKVRTLQANEISEPVKTRFGLHIIQLLETKPETTRSFTEVRDDLLEIAQKEKAEAVFTSQVDQFATLAFEHADTLSVVAQTLGLPIKSTDLFDRKGLKEDPVFSDAKVINAAFSESVLKEGYNSEVIGIDAQHVVVLRLKDHEPATPKPLAEVKASIIETLTQQKAKTEVETLAKTLLQNIQQGHDPNEIAKTHQLTWTTAQWIDRQAPQFEHEAIAETAFTMGYPETGKALYESVSLKNGDQALIALLAVKEESDKQIDTEQLKMYEVNRGRGDFNLLVTALKTDAKIKIYSDNL
jgi:peptidyl-prolyl cis-trans isomerase D